MARIKSLSNPLPLITTIALCLVGCAVEQRELVSESGLILPKVTIIPQITSDRSGQAINIASSLLPPVDSLAITLKATYGSASHTWPVLKQFPVHELYSTGRYTFTVTTPQTYLQKGYVDFLGNADFEVLPNSINSIPIDVTPAQALLQTKVDRSLETNMQLAELTAFTPGARIIPLASLNDENTEVFLYPGKTSFIATITHGDATSQTINPPFFVDLEAAKAQLLNASVSNDKLILSTNQGECVLPINSNPDGQQAPEISTKGFENGETIISVEGVPIGREILVEISSQTPLRSVLLSFASTSPLLRQMENVNLLVPSPAVDSLLALGLEIRHTGNNVVLDFTKFVDDIPSRAKISNRSIIMATDVNSQCSRPISFTIQSTPVELELAAVESATIGQNIAGVILNTTSTEIEVGDITVIATDDSGHKKEMPITSLTLLPNGQLLLKFMVPEGLDPVGVQIFYLNQSLVQTIIPRTVSPFEVTANNFATKTILKFSGAEEDVLHAITRLAMFKANGQRATVLERLPNECSVTLGNLLPGTKYEIGVILTSPNPVRGLSIATEEANQLPGGDFEDVAPLLSYKNLPSGGAFSTTDMPVVNRQNFTEINVSWPKKHWASVNAKTFCNKASTFNTWYTMPSAMVDFTQAASGSKSILLQSVGWDINGEHIPDYIQTPGHTIPYSGIVPNVNHQAAGRLFLGSYTFNDIDLTEKYTEGVPFNSRPTALNGFFKYIPDATVPTDRGKVVIELYGHEPSGREVIIASAHALLPFSANFTTFNIPLVYTRTDIPATMLKLNFFSSCGHGSIPYEDSNVPVTATPEKGMMLGSQLWIDNLIFTY